MRDLWAVLGRICLDDAFHIQVFSRANNSATFEQLSDLETFLRITNNLCLGRWDIMEINRVVTENYDGPGRMLVSAAQQDQLVTPIRFKLPKAGPLPFPGNQSFCSAVGLTSVDKRFRAMVSNMVTGGAPATALVDELSKSTEIHPQIPLSPGEATDLLALIKDKEAQIAAFHQAKWIVPDRIGCTAGYSPDADAAYMHVSQPGATAFLIIHPDKFQELFGNRVVQGAQALGDLFTALHVEFLPP